jgi:hypothetical protein
LFILASVSLDYSENKAEGRRQTAEGIKIFIGGAVLKVHDPLNGNLIKFDST